MDIHQDEFFVHYDKIKKTLNEIKVLINDRTKCLAKNEPIQEIDNNIKNKFNFIDQNSAKIKFVIENYTKKPIISQNEINRRTQLFTELMNSENVIKNQFNTSFIHTKLNKPDLIEMNKITPQDRKPSNENISQLAQEHISKQDDTFETYIGIVKKIKNKGRELGNEMNSQTPLLDKMERNIDKVDEKLQRTENKLKKFLERTSDNVIWKVIIAEMVILLLFILI